MTPLGEEEVRALRVPGYFVRDGVLGATAAKQVRDAAAAIARNDGLRAAGVSRAATPDARVRGDEMAWIDRANAPPAFLPVLALFDGLKEEANRAAWLGLERYDLQLGRYAGGGARYVKHLDAFGDTRGPNRRLTAIYYLNEAWTPDCGGALRVYLHDGTTRDVAPQLDRLVVFLSDRLEHEVLPAYTDRLALTAWYYGPDI
ncbi:MAG: 2OG-Fe(II) oxygenase [Myxococcaceae bacterium]|nr:2OG-Fe(II) oxygenase [Myxococcaceae bacterium]